MLKNYLKTALRNLWNNKTYSFLNIMGLSVGITCAALIFLWVEDELNFDHHNSRLEDLYQVYEHQAYEGKNYTFTATPGPLAKGMKEEIPGIKNTCRTTWQQKVLFSLGEKSVFEEGYYGDSSMFSMFTLPFVQGKPAHAFDQLHSLVISEKMAKKFFGEDKNIIGKTLKVDNKNEHVITGVMQDLPEKSTLQFEWVAPFQIYFNNNKWLEQWGNNGIQTFVETYPASNIDDVNKKLEPYIKSKDSAALARPFLLAMKDWRLHSDFRDGKPVTGRIQYVRMFTTIAWIILLIACINFMNLATARSEKRSREVGVRKVLGAAKKMLVLQFIGEAMLMSLIAVLVAVGIIYLVLPGFNVLVEKKLYLALNNPVHNTALLCIALACGLVAGSYPSIYLSSFKPIAVLKGLKSKAGSAAWIRKGLVVVQFSISIILIISTIIIYQQIQHAKNRDLGYNKDNLLQISLEGDLKKNYKPVKEELLASGFVDNTAMAMLNILWMGSSTSDYSWAGKDPGKQVLITQDWISPEYISTTGMKIRQGRDFYPEALQDSLSVIINEPLARMVDKENAVGKIISRDSTNYTIVGVTQDFVYSDMYAKGDPLIFLVHPDNYNYMYIRLKANSGTQQALSKIEAVLKKYNPGYPFDYKFVDENFDKIFQTEMLTGKLSRIFAILAVFISCLGLFGLAVYTAERRTKEIGIRKVLGASVASVASLLSKDFLRLVIIAIVVSIPVAWYAMNKWLQDFAYRIDIYWWVFAVAGVLAILIALLTVSFQAVRAAMANPVKNLRTE
ncbi:MAG: ABC transporter permease [Chitinophagaceae bacterium]